MKKSFYVNITPMHSGVTGSCFHLKVIFPDGARFAFLIDCGLFQEKEYDHLNEQIMPRILRTSDAILLTHNHVDHMGRVPELIRDGFKGKIYCSEPTAQLLDKAWADCKKVEETNAIKFKRYPRYKSTHITEAVRRLVPCGFEEAIQIFPNVTVTFFMNGHVCGAVIILVEIESGVEAIPPINFLFTGDYNLNNYFFEVRPLPDRIYEMPLHIITEATYGENNRQLGREEVFVENLLRELSYERNIVIPTFAFERGQRILSILCELQKQKLLDVNIPIYIDGKLLQIYTKHYMQMVKSFPFNGKEILPVNCVWVDKKSQREEIICDHTTRKIVVTTAGMAHYGPAQQYIPQFVTNPNIALHFTGYLCEGTAGRCLQNASLTGESVKLYGRIMEIKCQVFHTGEFSGHVSRTELLEFLAKFNNIKSLALNHGSTKAIDDLARTIISKQMVKEVVILSRGLTFKYDSYKFVKTTESFLNETSS